MTTLFNDWLAQLPLEIRNDCVDYYSNPDCPAHQRMIKKLTQKKQIRLKQLWTKVRNMVKIRPYVFIILEEYTKSRCAENGEDRKRDRAAYEADFC